MLAGARRSLTAALGPSVVRCTTSRGATSRGVAATTARNIAAGLGSEAAASIEGSLLTVERSASQCGSTRPARFIAHAFRIIRLSGLMTDDEDNFIAAAHDATGQRLRFSETFLLHKHRDPRKPLTDREAEHRAYIDCGSERDMAEARLEVARARLQNRST